MSEPDWNEVRGRLMALTMRQMRPVRWWFSGCLGGATAKGDVVREMVSQMRHWWHHADGGPARVARVLAELDEAEGAS